MIESKDYVVTLTLKLTTKIIFSPIERDHPITKADAIENAIGYLPQHVIDELEGEGFEIAYPIEGEATLEE